jgi:MFS family permease
MGKNFKLRKNISRNYIFTLLQNIDLTRGIWMIYLASKGMSLTQLGLLETIFHITSFTMEVPTGAIADLFGRKTSRVLGRLFGLMGLILMLFSNNFYWFAVSFIFSSLSYNLESGAGDALIYDSLKELNKEDQYMRISGNKELFYQMASTISFLAGGYLAAKSYRIAFILSIIIGAITILQALTFFEPSIGRSAVKDRRKKFLAQLKSSIKVVRDNTKIGTLIVFVQIIMAFVTCMFYYLQNYLKEMGYNEAKIGMVYAIASIMSAITATQVHKIEKKIKEKGLLLIMPFITVVCIWGIALTKYNYVFFIILMITESIIYVAVSDYINKMIPSENRATILSFASMVFSFFMITLFPFIGMIGDKYSLRTAFKLLGIISIVLVILNCFMLIRGTGLKRKPKPEDKAYGSINFEEKNVE